MAQTQHPVRWTPAVGPPSRRAFLADLKRPLKVPPGAEIYYEDANGRRRQIRTCAVYKIAVENGWWDDADAHDMARAARFVEKCEVLELILAAKQSRVSYLEDFKLEEAALDLLPSSFAFTPYPRADEDGLSRTNKPAKASRPKLK
jgi:hypothetical protein